MSGTHAVLYDPHGLIEAELPLDRAPYEALVIAVLACADPHLEPRDYTRSLVKRGIANLAAADLGQVTRAVRRKLKMLQSGRK